MQRSVEDIIDHANELSQRFEGPALLPAGDDPEPTAELRA